MQPVQIEELHPQQHAGPKAKSKGTCKKEAESTRSCQRATASARASVHEKLLAGATAGAAAKTMIAPLDRIKILFQVGKAPFTYTNAYKMTKVDAYVRQHCGLMSRSCLIWRYVCMRCRA